MSISFFENCNFKMKYCINKCDSVHFDRHKHKCKKCNKPLKYECSVCELEISVSNKSSHEKTNEHIARSKLFTIVLVEYRKTRMQIDHLVK